MLAILDDRRPARPDAAPRPAAPGGSTASPGTAATTSAGSSRRASTAADPAQRPRPHVLPAEADPGRQDAAGDRRRRRAAGRLSPPTATSRPTRSSVRLQPQRARASLPARRTGEAHPEQHPARTEATCSGTAAPRTLVAGRAAIGSRSIARDRAGNASARPGRGRADPLHPGSSDEPIRGGTGRRMRVFVSTDARALPLVRGPVLPGSRRAGCCWCRGSRRAGTASWSRRTAISTPHTVISGSAPAANLRGRGLRGPTHEAHPPRHSRPGRTPRGRGRRLLALEDRRGQDEAGSPTVEFKPKEKPRRGQAAEEGREPDALGDLRLRPRPGRTSRRRSSSPAVSAALDGARTGFYSSSPPARRVREGLRRAAQKGRFFASRRAAPADRLAQAVPQLHRRVADGVARRCLRAVPPAPVRLRRPEPRASSSRSTRRRAAFLLALP